MLVSLLKSAVQKSNMFTWIFYIIGTPSWLQSVRVKRVTSRSNCLLYPAVSKTIVEKSRPQKSD